MSSLARLSLTVFCGVMILNLLWPAWKYGVVRYRRREARLWHEEHQRSRLFEEEVNRGWGVQRGDPHWRDSPFTVDRQWDTEGDGT